MALNSHISIIILVLSTSLMLIDFVNGSQLNTTGCSPWTKPTNTVNNCECGSDLCGIVQCNSKTLEVSVKACYCMTYSERRKEALLSYCVYTCLYDDFHEYHPITTQNVSELNEEVCGSFNRTGLMCGECIEEHAPSVYSYDLACVECKDYKYNWLKYIAVAYLPLTAFYILIIVLRVSVNSGPMVVYVTVSQMLAASGIIRFAVNAYQIKQVIYMLVISLYSVWNLDFFRGLYQPFCLHPDMSILQITSLDYVIGIYPLILISITYLIVQLCDRFIVTSRLWLPVYRCCSMFRRKWDIKMSLVNAFATFLILSYVKIMNVSFDILTFSPSYYDVQGNRSVGGDHLYINGSIKPFSKEHKPYAILAIVMLIIFNFLPLVLLCAYPSRCFQKCLNCTKCQYRTLHVFMDTFQGCYKETPRDCRYFAGFYLFLRSVNLLSFTATKNPVYLSLAMYMMIFALFLVAICRPYKNLLRNMIDIVLFLVMIAMYATVLLVIDTPYVVPRMAIDKVENGWILFFVVPVILILPLYITCLMIHRVLSFLMIPIPNCNCCMLIRKRLLLLTKGELTSFECSFSRHDNECSSLLK